MKKSLPKKYVSIFALALMLVGSSTLFHAQELHAAPKAGSAQSSGVVNVNTADFDELQSVRGIGPAVARRIVEYRKQHGEFEHIEDLAEIRGIGKAKLKKIKKQVSL